MTVPTAPTMRRSAPAAISVLACDDTRSRAELVGVFDRGNVEFLRRHLEELAGDVLLECARLEDVDEAAAAVLLAFRSQRRAHGRQVLFRGIDRRCRRTLTDRATRADGRLDSDERSVRGGPQTAFGWG